MPLLLSESLPSPTVKSYVLFSGVLLAASLLYGGSILEEAPHEELSRLEVLQKDSFCLWSVVNMAYCCLFVFGKLLEHLVFGQLTLQEQQHLHDKFWNYVFYKIIFIFGVINAQSFDEVMCWTAWFSMLGFWHIFGQLSKDRYESLTSSPHTAKMDHAKLFSLLVFICLSGFALAAVIAYFGMTDGWNTFGFILAECMLLSLKALQIIVKYTIQLQDISMLLWERKSVKYYYLDIGLELGVLAIDMMHHLHMLMWSNVFLSMASLVLYWNIQTIFNDFKRRWSRHKAFKLIVKNVETRFPWASSQELSDYSDNCAICWEDILSGRKLPCNHIYHHACLCSWLQQDVSCPICRCSLSSALGIPNSNPAGNLDHVDVQPFVEQQGNQRNHFFHFDGNHIASWFPSFSVEVFRSGNENVQDLDAMVFDLDAMVFDLDAMAHHVASMFPALPRAAVVADLQLTQSAEMTIENILEGNVAPQDTTSGGSHMYNSDSAVEDLSEEEDTDVMQEAKQGSLIGGDTAEEKESIVSGDISPCLPGAAYACVNEESNSTSELLLAPRTTSLCYILHDVRRRGNETDHH